VLQARGEYGRAEPFCRDALAMYRKLYPKGKYPDGHPDLARSLNNLGSKGQPQLNHGLTLIDPACCGRGGSTPRPSPSAATPWR
jgi:hypothetical protein